METADAESTYQPCLMACPVKADPGADQAARLPEALGQAHIV
jgi:hypothetical protein